MQPQVMNVLTSRSWCKPSQTSGLKVLPGTSSLTSRHPFRTFGSWQMTSWPEQDLLLHSTPAAPLKSSTNDGPC